ncbi:MAG: pentapeptide repeat-containing protein [Luteolibacter sp.]
MSKPISVLNRELKADWGGMFSAMRKGAEHLSTMQVWELAWDVGDAVRAMGLKMDVGGLAWILIRKSLLRAMHALTSEAWLNRLGDAPAPPKELVETLDAEMAKTVLEVRKDFFEQPASLPFFESCRGWFGAWLMGAGFTEREASSITTRMCSYFVYALNQEWRENAELYKPVLDASTTPFSAAGARERAWREYAAWLDQELDGGMFGELFSLRQLYVPLRAYYLKLESTEDLHARARRGDKAGGNRIAVDLTSHLLNWVAQTDRKDCFRVISGGPGSGKSSLAKMLTADVLEKTQWRAIYLPLHQLRYESDVAPAIERYLREAGLLRGLDRPFDHETGEKQLLLIFDGLDELAMLGKIAENAADRFVRAVKELVGNCNTVALRVKAIFTGRTMTMQGLESEFRKEGEILHLCPYYVAASEKEEYLRGWKLLEQEDQRQRWWKTYGELSGKDFDGLPTDLNREDLLEISSEPLLNYLLALTLQRGTLDFSNDITQNQIYGTLVDSIHARRWGTENFAVRNLSLDHFHRLLEEIAVAAWHGDGRKTTVGEIKKHCSNQGIARLLDTFQEGAEHGVLRLLTAFFFRKAGERSDENAFEFTHKSFGEYLVARRIVRLLGEMERKQKEQRDTFDGWDERACLEKWGRLCGPAPMTGRQAGFLRNEMHADTAAPEVWQPMLVGLVNSVLRHDMPMEKLALPDYRTMLKQSRNAEGALLVALNACARVTEKISVIAWSERNGAATWIRHIQGFETGMETALIDSCLSYTSFKKQLMQLIDLSNGDFSHSDLSEAFLEGAHFTESQFFNADFTSSVAPEISLSMANLRFCNLSESSLIDADLSHADMTFADLSGAMLDRADMRGANLSGAKLTGADLSNAILVDANLREADLRNADLSNADFYDALLEGALFDGANLTRQVREYLKSRGANL